MRGDAPRKPSMLELIQPAPGLEDADADALATSDDSQSLVAKTEAATMGGAEGAEEGREAEEEAVNGVKKTATAATLETSETSAASATSARGEKPWYRKQHEIASLARQDGQLLARQAVLPQPSATAATSIGDVSLELWRNGEDVAALLVAHQPGMTSGKSTEADETAEVVGSVVYRRGPLTTEMRALLRRRLPEVPRLLPRRRPQLAGMVHVYVVPTWRGSGWGERLTSFSLDVIRREGISHVLTLADDAGSGQLVSWYAALGFVEAPEFEAPGEVAMVARTGA